MIGYSDFGVEPDGFVLLDSGSLFEFSGESFKKYLHGITQRKVDEINDKVMNKEFLEYKEGEKLKRGNRISILIWSE
jgi:hypothetical protein